MPWTIDDVLGMAAEFFVWLAVGYGLFFIAYKILTSEDERDDE